ncbi:NDP-sugar dehydrogenase [Aurantimicrobium sp. INA4]|uniref:nucleotide sugar dehydrogenase n=1 Tax=Aurantimicrobium sp. INA4 TaxID=2986279 RepID=UPI0024909A1A|nr:nucleotide sugar dehydrogenase [Aurantimicrobium sp. INA4]BDU11239.1 NDP-sugar dehydrogenase [Aurantimicrobium sp. INA4]
MTNLPNNKFDVCVVGLGYVGLTLATALASAGLRVAGSERSQDVVDLIASGQSPFHEFGLDEAIQAVVSRGKLVPFALEDGTPVADSYVITVGTPVKNGSVYLEDLKSAVSAVANVMPDGALTVLRSTVRVGTTRTIAEPILKDSGKKYAVAMAPERTIEGKALAELSSLPQIVGGIDENSTQLASELFARLGVEIVPVHSAEAAELAKLASNTFRDVSFAFANELAYFADQSGVDVYDVVRACNYGYDRMNVALPGPVAGPCLEKDAYILSNSADVLGVEVPLAMQGRKTNEFIVSHVVNSLLPDMNSHTPKVSILGLAFKGRPATSDTRGSLAGDFAQAMKSKYSVTDVSGWDPLVSVTDAQKMGILFDELEECLNSDVVLIQTNHRFFSSEDFYSVIDRTEHSGRVFVDLWNQLDAERITSLGNRLIPLGRKIIDVKDSLV